MENALASDLSAFQINRGLTELFNCQEKIACRRQQRQCITNEILDSEMREELERIANECKSRFQTEVNNIRQRAGRIIRKLENDTELRRRKIAEEIEIANARFADAQERIELTKHIEDIEIPEVDFSGLLGKAVYEKKIEGLKDTIKNLESKRPMWEKTERELAKLENIRLTRRKTTRPSHRNSPLFVMSMKTITGT